MVLRISLALTFLFLMACTSPSKIKRETSSFKKENKCIPNLVDQFRNLESKKRKVYQYKKGDHFPFGDYKMSVFNKLGIENHFQGLAKVSDNEQFIVSGGNLNIQKAHLFFIDKGRILKSLDITEGNIWHPGGLQAAGKVVAIPIIAYKVGKGLRLIFFDLTDFNSPKKLDFELRSEGSGKSVGFMKLPNQKYMLLRMGRGDVYISKTENIEDGFYETPNYQLKKNKLLNDPKRDFFFNSNNVSLLKQCDGRIFLLTFENSSKAAPIIPGKDMANLIELKFPNGDFQDNPELHFVHQKSFQCGRHCNFDAGVTAYINQEGKLQIYAVPHFRTFIRGQVKIVEFSSPSP